MLRSGGNRCRALTVVGVGGLLVLGSAPHAAAETPPVPDVPRPASPAPAESAPVAAVAAKLRLTTEGPSAGVFQGDRWRAVVTLTPAVAGTHAIVTFTTTGGAVRTRTVTLRTSKDGTRSVGRVDYRNQKTSRIVVRAAIDIGQPAAPTRARTKIVTQVSPSLHPGERGAAVRILQATLKKKGYVVGRPGTFDARTQRAVIAFRKVTGMPWSSVADRAVFRALRAGKGTFRVRFPQHGRHVEGDIDRQVLALIGADGTPERIYHTSPGAPATPTIRGSFRVYTRDPGTNAKGMYKSSYFIRGYAIHGYHDVPLYNASHGCFRVPMADADAIFTWMSIGMRVDTY